MSAETKVKVVTKGTPFLTLLGLLFIGLKLGGLIDWSWWLVLLPLYGPIALGLLLIGAGLAIVLFVDRK